MAEQGIIVRHDGAIETAAGTIPADLRRAAELYAVYMRGQAFHALANALRKIAPKAQFDPQLASLLEEMARIETAQEEEDTTLHQ